MKHHKNKPPQGSTSDAITDPKQIEQRAYELFVEHGSVPGNDLQDWLWAERELKGSALAGLVDK
jgi:hypothetical protein